MPKHKTSRDEIIQNSLKLFEELGYANTSVKDIGDECGVYKGSIYHFFPTKLALLEAVFDHYYDISEKEVFRVAWNISLPHAVRIDTYFENYKKNIVKNSRIPLYIELISESRLTIEVGKLADIYLRDFLKSLQTLINHDEHGKRLMHLIIGYHISAIRERNTIDLSDIRTLTHTFAVVE